ncbi:MAG: hypothetical protein KGQ88_02115 [Chloroflexi bacterium]|nr:hypothetical protein [Chloroflexota bacterium]
MTLASVASPFSRERDLQKAIALTGRLRTDPRGSASLHPGGLQWLLRGSLDPDFPMRVWYEGNDLVAFVVWEHAALIRGASIRST